MTPLYATVCLLLAFYASAQRINEIHYNNVGTDINEGVEVRAPAGTDLSGFYPYFISGGGGQYERTRVCNQGGCPCVDTDNTGFCFVTITRTLQDGGAASNIPSQPARGVALGNADPADSSGGIVDFISTSGVLTGNAGAT